MYLVFVSPLAFAEILSVTGDCCADIIINTTFLICFVCIDFWVSARLSMYHTGAFIASTHHHTHTAHWRLTHVSLSLPRPAEIIRNYDLMNKNHEMFREIR